MPLLSPLAVPVVTGVKVLVRAALNHLHNVSTVFKLAPVKLYSPILASTFSPWLPKLLAYGNLLPSMGKEHTESTLPSHVLELPFQFLQFLANSLMVHQKDTHSSAHI